jgi:hypothetical protein
MSPPIQYVFTRKKPLREHRGILAGLPFTHHVKVSYCPPPGEIHLPEYYPAKLVCWKSRAANELQESRGI